MTTPSVGSPAIRSPGLDLRLRFDGNYTLTAADLGKTITVMARYMDGGGFEHNFSSAGTPLVYPAYYPPDPITLWT